jgi:hypothetical protein
MRISLLFLIPFHVLFVACDKHPAKAAFFIEPSGINLQTTAVQGSGSHKISDLWLYVDGQYQGCYPVGKLLPVPNEGRPVTIHMFAGIKNNGISTTRVPWRLYDIFRLDTTVESGRTVSIPVTFRYSPATTFTWVENCEGEPSLGIRKSSKSDADLIFPASQSFEGKSVGMVLTPQDVIGQMESAAEFGLPRFSLDVYLELNYKSNSPFVVGVIDSDGLERAALVINPQEEWNKIYVQLASVISVEPASPRFKIYLRMDNHEQKNLELFVDNLKLVYL